MHGGKELAILPYNLVAHDGTASKELFDAFLHTELNSPFLLLILFDLSKPFYANVYTIF